MGIGMWQTLYLAYTNTKYDTAVTAASACDTNPAGARGSGLGAQEAEAPPPPPPPPPP